MYRRSLWLFVGVALAGGIGIVALVLLRGNTPANQSGAVSPADETIVPVQHSAGSMEFDLVPQRQGIESVARAVEERVEGVSGDILSDPLLAEKLGDAVAGRMAMMMHAEIDAWSAEAGRFAEAPDLDSIDPFFKNTLRERWLAAARGYEKAPVASSGISVRAVSVDEEPEFDVGAPGLMLRAAAGLASANYPLPPTNDPLMRAVEVMIPMKIRTEGSRTHDQPAMVALRLFWNSRLQEWQPYDLILYVDYSVAGKTVPFPYL